MFQSTGFTFDGISSADMYNIMIVRVGDSGMLQQPFGIRRKPISESVRNRHKIYSYGFQSEVLEFPLQLAKEGKWSYEERVAVSSWLIQDGYKTFVSDDFPLEVDVAVVGEPYFYVAGDYGYIDLRMESNVPFLYSPTSISEYDLSTNPTNTIITMENKSNLYNIYKPEIQFSMQGSTSVKLENLTRGGEIMEFTSLNSSEILYCDCESERIYSALSDTRLNNLTNHKFLKLSYGINQIRVTGQVIIETRMRYPMTV